LMSSPLLQTTPQSGYFPKRSSIFENSSFAVIGLPVLVNKRASVAGVRIASSDLQECLLVALTSRMAFAMATVSTESSVNLQLTFPDPSLP